MSAVVVAAPRGAQPRVTPRRMIAGAVALTGLALRRDRGRLIAWVIGLVALFALTASAWDRLYPTPQSRIELGATLGASPALTALLGPVFDPLSTGGLTAWRLATIVTAILGLVNTFLVVRHTRAEEVDGRAELALSGRVGRAAPLAAALLVVVVLDSAFAATVAVVLGGSLGWSGASALGAGVAVGAFAFAGVAALAAQVARTGRAANGLASLVLALAFASAAGANASSLTPGGPLLWWSPFGWVQQVRAFAEDRWWVIGLAGLVSLVLAGAALLIAGRRDLGDGLLTVRPGPARLRAGSIGPWRLALRLDRGSLLAWLVGTVVWGMLIGLLVTAAVRLVEDSPGLAELIRSLGGAGSIADAYVLLMGTLLALVASAYGITTMLRVHQDEVSGRAELLLSGRVPRTSWFLSRVLTASIGMVAILVLATAASGLVYALSSDGTRGVLAEAGRFAGAGLMSASAAAVVVAVAALIVGAWPRWTSLAWAALVWAGIVAWLGPLLDLPDAILRTSPFWYVPSWPVETFEPEPVIALVAVAAGLVGLAVVLLRRRSLPAG